MRNFIFGYLFGTVTIILAIGPLYWEITTQRERIREAAKVFVNQVPDRLRIQFELGVMCGINSVTSNVSDRAIESDSMKKHSDIVFGCKGELAE